MIVKHSINIMIFNTFILESASSSDLKESFAKYSHKLNDHVSKMDCYPPEVQAQVSEYVSRFLKEFEESFDLNDQIVQEDTIFIEALRKFPEEALAANYVQLWDTVVGLESSDIPNEEMLVFLESAVTEYARQVAETKARDFSQLLASYASEFIFANNDMILDKMAEYISEAQSGKKA